MLVGLLLFHSNSFIQRHEEVQRMPTTSLDNLVANYVNNMSLCYQKTKGYTLFVHLMLNFTGKNRRSFFNLITAILCHFTGASEATWKWCGHSEPKYSWGFGGAVSPPTDPEQIPGRGFRGRSPR